MSSWPPFFLHLIVGAYITELELSQYMYNQNGGIDLTGPSCVQEERILQVCDT